MNIRRGVLKRQASANGLILSWRRRSDGIFPLSKIPYVLEKGRRSIARNVSVDDIRLSVVASVDVLGRLFR